MDALTHNIESYLSPAYHPLCDGIALEGLRIAARALRHRGARAAATCEARSDMMMSSMMGAIAFQKDLGAVHSCAHALGAVCDLHHGLANALMIDTVLRLNLEAVPDEVRRARARRRRRRGGGAAFVPLARAAEGATSASPAALAARGVHARAASAALVDVALRRHLPPDQPAARAPRPTSNASSREAM